MEWQILEVLSPDERQALLALTRRRRFARNEVIFHEGDPGDTLHLVAKGHVAVRVTTPLGDVATVRVLKAGEFFGELAIISPGPRNATAVALDPVETRAIHRDQFDALRTRDPAIDRVIIEALVTEVRRLAVQLVDALYIPVEKRIWRRVGDLAGIFGSGDGSAVNIPLTQEELAQVVGATRPTVNRTLKEGEDAGVVRLGRGRVEVLDRDAVARLAR
jgi:CRP/FNR family cyclic AMP-dependent transcriptional regulator